MFLVIQTPTAQGQTNQPYALIHRQFHRKQTDRYAVTVESQGGAGHANYDYDLKLVAANGDPKSVNVTFDASLMNLRARFNDEEVPKEKEFGLATLVFGRTGLPSGITLAMPDPTLVIPLLCWYLPDEAGEPGSDIKLPQIDVDGTVHLNGTATWTKRSSTRATLKISLVITTGKVGQAKPDKAPGTFDATSTFNVANGDLLSSDGNFSGFGGSLTYRVRRL